MSNQTAALAMGVGSPIVDLLAQVDDEFLKTVHGAKGGMELIGPDSMEEIIKRITGTTVKAAGGSAGNTIFAMAKLGQPCAFLGKLGHDEDGAYYQKCFADLGGDPARFKTTNEAYTARCLSLITPDSERTMRTDLGAAAKLTPEEISVADFKDIAIVHAEGYLLFNPALAEKVLQCAKAAGCKISIDLGSFEVVKAAESELHMLIEKYVDYVFANEDEAAAFVGHDDPRKALDEIGALCEIAAVKLGADGAWIQRNGETVRANANKVDAVVDTTGAGDLWAAGFLYGIMQGKSLDVAGQYGALLGGEVVQQIGAKLPENTWSSIQTRIAEIG